MTFPDEEIDAYTRPFAVLGGVRGALAHIRALPSSAALNQKLAEKVLEMPVLAIGAELSFGKYMAAGLADSPAMYPDWSRNDPVIGFPKNVPTGFQNGC